MTITPDQLRAQRELVKRHLDWLDAQIADASGAPPAKLSPVVSDSSAIDTSGVARKVDVAPELSSEPVPAVAVDAILETHSSESGLSQGAKLGCFAVAAVIVLGFLFILFVLPRFIYKKNSSEPAPQEQVRP